MADVKYNLKEALNRIYRVLIGGTNPTDAPDTVSGEIYSVDEAASLIAELLESKLAGQTLTIPNANYGTLTTGEVQSDELNAGTGTFYAGYSEVSIGGFDTDALFGNGKICLGIGPRSIRPSGTLSHLGGVLFAENGNLMWLGSSGTVSTIAGS